MFIGSSQDLMFFVLAIALIWVSGFLCWALYELARFFRQTNAIVAETRETSGRLNVLIREIVDKASGVLKLADVITKFGKGITKFIPQADEADEETEYTSRRAKRNKKKIRMSEVP